MDLNEEKEGASLMSFGREYQLRGPTDRKPLEASVVLWAGMTRPGTKSQRKYIRIYWCNDDYVNVLNNVVVMKSVETEQTVFTIVMIDRHDVTKHYRYHNYALKISFSMHRHWNATRRGIIRLMPDAASHWCHWLLLLATVTRYCCFQWSRSTVAKVDVATGRCRHWSLLSLVNVTSRCMSLLVGIYLNFKIK